MRVELLRVLVGAAISTGIVGAIAVSVMDDDGGGRAEAAPVFDEVMRRDASDADGWALTWKTRDGTVTADIVRAMESAEARCASARDDREHRIMVVRSDEGIAVNSTSYGAAIESCVDALTAALSLGPYRGTTRATIELRARTSEVAVAPRTSSSKTTLLEATPEVGGDYDAPIINRYVARHRKDLQACFDARESPKQRATVVSFTIDPSGFVSNARGPDALGRCLAHAIESIQFPMPRGGAIEVTYPLKFPLKFK